MSTTTQRRAHRHHGWRAALGAAVLSLASLATAGTLGAGAAGAASPAATGPHLTVTPSSTLAFPATPVGRASTTLTVRLTNTGTADVAITGFQLGGADPDDFIGLDDCFSTTSFTTGTGSAMAVLAPGQSCTVAMLFLPGAAGARSATLTVVDNEPTPTVLRMSGTGTEGYYLAGADGGVFAYGNAQFEGSMGGKHLNAPIISMATTPVDNGYWLLGQDGGIFSFGTAIFYGSMGGSRLNAPVVSMAATPSGLGYWEVASDGGIFAFGAAQFYGSMGGRPLEKPIVGIAATPTGGGYWEVASDGGIFAFGNATFYGSMGGQHLNQPIVGIAATPTGGGYWEVASDGGIFAFGAAQFYGSTGALGIHDVVEMSSSTGSSYQAELDVPAARSEVTKRLDHPGWSPIGQG